MAALSLDKPSPHDASTVSSVAEPVSSGTPHPLPPVICKGCSRHLEESSDSVVVSFGNSLWHVNCRCAKCRNFVEHDSNLLLLSDGSPVCEKCSYICSACGLAVSNEAIVTGDDSYHSECFKCRSCHSRIEELIFAKTTQGIYCMSCHNERVSRSRKHAESRRQKSIKRDQRNLHNTPRSRIGTPHSTSSATPYTPDTPARSPGAFATPSSQVQTPATTYNVPSPRNFASENPELLSSSSPASSVRSQSQQSGLETPRYNHDHLAVSQPSLSVTSHTGDSILHIQKQVDSAQPSSTPDKAGASPVGEQLSSNSAQQHEHPTQSTSSSMAAKDNRLASPRNPTTSPSSSRQRSASLTNRPYTSDGSTPALLSQSAEPSSKSDPDLENPASSSLLSVSPQDTKQANRRSGFIGAPSSNSVETASPEESAKSGSVEEDEPDVFQDTRSTISPQSSPQPQKLATSPRTPAEAPQLPDMGRHSLTFYDPDVLLFLDAVGYDGTEGNVRADKISEKRPNGPSSSPKHVVSKSESAATLTERNNSLHPTTDSGQARSKSLARLDGSSSTTNDEYHKPDGEEHDQIQKSNNLSNLPQTQNKNADNEESADDQSDIEDSDTISDTKVPDDQITRKVRESIRKSRADGSAMSVNVDLVEMLLGELEETKDKMKNLQTDYTAMRRVSRQVYEGFSMTHDEFNKEVAARKEAEGQMEELRSQLKEAASKLSALDAHQKKEEAMKRRSVELKSDLIGMEQQLSSLQVKREMVYAEVEELANVDSKAPPALEAISSRLSTRLDKIKEEHKQQLQALAAQKDKINDEIRELSSLRDSLSEEEASLRRKKEELSLSNLKSQQELDTVRAKLAQLELRHKAATKELPPDGASMKLHHTPRLSSSTSSRHPPSSFEHGIHSSGLLHAQKAEPAPPAVKKFKWGKHKGPSESHRQQPSISKSNLSAKSSSPGDNNNSSRQHFFQATSILRPVRCEHCGDKMWGLQELRCTACGIYCHSRCAPHYNIICNSAVLAEDSVSATSSVFGLDLKALAQSEGNTVPMIVSKCIEAVEERGMDFEGIYRKTGGMSSVKAIQNAFDRREDIDLVDRDKYNDLGAVTSVFKNWLRELPDPLFTFELHEEFVSVVEIRENHAKIERLKAALDKLPESHYATLRALIHHLHKITTRASENKMTASNLGVVFGPTLLRSKDIGREFSDMGPKAQLCEYMIESSPMLFR